MPVFLEIAGIKFALQRIAYSLMAPKRSIRLLRFYVQTVAVFIGSVAGDGIVLIFGDFGDAVRLDFNNTFLGFSYFYNESDMT